MKNFNVELDKEYLSRKIVETNFNITNDYIKIDCSHTLYCNASRIKKTFSKTEILETYNNIYQLAKQKQVKIGRKNGYKKFITEYWNKYLQAIEYYNNLFNELVLGFQEVEKRKLHSGTRDDQVLHMVQNIRNKYQEVYYSNSVYSKMNDIYRSLNKLLVELQDDSIHFEKIVL